VRVHHQAKEFHAATFDLWLATTVAADVVATTHAGAETLAGR
jgi:hypothetical protein